MVQVWVKRKAYEIPVSADVTLGEFKEAFHKQFRKYYPTRQSFKLGNREGEPVPNAKALSGDDTSLADLGLGDGAASSLLFKDYGPQFSYRGVFVVEYAGPLLFVLLYAMRPAFLYGPDAASKPWDPVAKLGVWCWTAHFAKREFETFFVHRFSRPTMPLLNLFKNSIYYHTFGLVIGYPLCHPDFTAPASELQVQIACGAFILFELGNLICHIMLRNLRPAEGSSKRPIPSGFLFDLVACPNYTFEIACWVAYSFMTQIFFCYLFTIVGGLQMWIWAKGKHRGYIKTYGDEYKKLRRKPMIPFLC